MPLSSDDIRKQLRAIYRQEQEEHLQAIRLILSSATYDEQTGNSRPLTGAERDEVYRRMHSLKGAARAVDFEEVEQIAHRAEAVLGRIRAEEITIPENLLYRRLQEVMDVLEALALLQDSDEPHLQEATERTVQTAMRAIDALEAPAAQEQVAPQAAPVAAPPVASPPVFVPPVPASSTIPTPEVAPVRPVPETVPAPATVAEDVVRISSKQLDTLLTSVRQFQQEMERQQHFLETELLALERRLQTQTDTGVADDTHTLRLRYREYSWRVQRIAAQMADEVQSVRLVAVESAMEGMERMLRGIARQSGKDVALQVSGGAIQVDREVAQALRDPLTHLLRNTISHGIETETERLAKGKPGFGNVMVRFRIRGTRLEIDIQDDGRGLNEQNIRRTAVTSRLLTPEAAQTAPLEQVAQLIFQPGFSTFGTADRLAGRGMGLSIVAQTVARLGGEVRVQPAPASLGTLFRLWLPLSVATHRLLLVDVADQVFGLPTFVVEGLHRVATERLEPVENGLVLRLGDGAVVPVSDLDSLLGLSPVIGGDAHDNLPLSVAVVHLGGERHALIVQRFRTEAMLPVRPLGAYLPNLPLFGGSVVLSDGTIGLTLLPAELTRRVRGGGAAGALATAVQKRTVAAQQKTPTILVADDSITTRTLEKSILEAHGYQVRLAVDGEEALVLLRESVSRPDERIDLVVSDLEMPRRTGFELLSAVRDDPRLSTLPFILVTSREAFEDREMGLSLGADAYIVKQKFDQSALLETIEQLLRQV